MLPELSIDRSRAAEEAAAAAMLGGEIERTEQEDGTVTFESETGTVEWRADGRVRGSFAIGEEAPADAEAAGGWRAACFRTGAFRRRTRSSRRTGQRQPCAARLRACPCSTAR